MWSSAKGSGMRSHSMPGATAMGVPAAGGVVCGYSMAE